jgi:hypothetical protein
MQEHSLLSSLNRFEEIAIRFTTSDKVIKGRFVLFYLVVISTWGKGSYGSGGYWKLPSCIGFTNLPIFTQ